MDFINYGVPTDDGKRVLAHMRAQCEMAEARGLDAINGMAGHVAYFYINVHKGRFITETDWLKGYSNAAMAAYLDMQQLEEAQAKAAQADATQTALSESLDALRAELNSALDRLAKLEAEKAPPADEPTPEPEAEAAAEVEAAPVESKPDKKGKKEAVTEPEAAPEPEAEA